MKPLPLRFQQDFGWHQQVLEFEYTTPLCLTCHSLSTVTNKNIRTLAPLTFVRCNEESNGLQLPLEWLLKEPPLPLSIFIQNLGGFTLFHTPGI